jgi:hypothetical protein
MKLFTRTAVAGIITGVVATAVPSAAATTCPSDAEVRQQITDLVVEMRDDVRNRSARAATADALRDTLETMHGARAQSPAERRALGQEISALAQQRRESSVRVERQALAISIRALVEQREREPLTEEERTELLQAVSAVKNAVMARTDTQGERRDVGAAFRSIVEGFSCSTD